MNVALIPLQATLSLIGATEMYGLYSYHWTNCTTGLAYLEVGVGSLAGMIITSKFMDSSFTTTPAP